MDADTTTQIIWAMLGISALMNVIIPLIFAAHKD